MSRKWKIIGKAFIGFLLTIPIDIAGFVIVPLALLLCSKEDEHLPHLFYWWDEPEFGINGDPPWRGPEHANGHEREYVWRVRWLFRNRTGGWAFGVQGINSANISAVVYEGDPNTGNRPGHSGDCYIKVLMNDGKEYECYYHVSQWGNSDKCVRGYFGHKLMDVLHQHLGNKPFDDGYIPSVFSFNPLMGFER